MRTIIVGDIHGSYKEWEQLLEIVHFNNAADQLILLGDLMDRGKSSYKVFRRAVRLQAEMQERFVLIKGSHEKFLLDEHLGILHQLLWLAIGKLSTVRSFRQHGQSMIKSIPWFQKHSVPYFESKNFQCTHAGVRNEKLSENNEHTLMMDHKWVRRNLYNGKLTITGHIHLKEPTWFDGSGNKGKRLPYNQWLPLPIKGTICIDTGCAEGNKLTAMVIEGDKYYLASVSAAR